MSNTSYRPKSSCYFDSRMRFIEILWVTQKKFVRFTQDYMWHVVRVRCFIDQYVVWEEVLILGVARTTRIDGDDIAAADASSLLH